MRRYLAPVALFLIALPAAADAPDDQYDAFDYKSTTITDRKTGLTWDRRLDPFQTVITVQGNFTTATTACSGFSFNSKQGRIPSIKELLTLFDEDPHPEYTGSGAQAKYIHYKAFPGIRVDAPFWSSTAADGANVWTLNFGTGEMKQSAKTDPGAVLCTF